MIGSRFLSGSQRMVRMNSRDYALERYAAQKATPVTIQQMMLLHNEKQRLHFAPHLKQELMIRVAKRHMEMRALPNRLRASEPVKRVEKLYYDFFNDLSVLQSPEDQEPEQKFTELIRDFYENDSATLPFIAQGMGDFKHTAAGQDLFSSPAQRNALDAELDDLFTARLSVRMLIGQHAPVSKDGTGSKIKRGLCVANVARQASNTTTQMCLKRFGVCPEVEVVGHLDFKFTYVESHLHHMLFELLKNSVRAVVETHHGKAGEERRKRLKLSGENHLGPDGLPKVVVAISGGSEDVVIKVSDEGGGIARSDLDKIWSYQYTTASQQEQEVQDDDSLDNQASFIRFRENFYGFGYGLPIARVFARYFGGDLNVISTEGWGTDAFIYINRLESASVETLPE